MYMFKRILVGPLLLITLASCGQKTPIWQEQYDLGVCYLSEGNYEEAIIAFTAAIEIDPKQAPVYVGRGNAYVLSGETEDNLSAAKADYEKAIELDETNAEAYLGLANVYIRQEEYDKALKILNGALDKVGNPVSIQDKINELEGENISNSSGSDTNLLEKGATNNMIRFEEVNFLGHSIENLNIGTMKELLAQNGFEFDEQNDGESWWVGSNSIGTEYGAEISALQYKNQDYVCLWGYTHYTYAIDRLPLPIGVRDIRTCDTLETVLTQLGFSNGTEISEYIQKTATTPSNSMEEIDELFNKLTYTAWNPETNTSTLFMFTGNGSCTPLDDGTYIPNQAELEVTFFFTEKKSFTLRFIFTDTAQNKFGNCLHNYNVNIW